MLSFEQIKKLYPESLHGFQTGLLREYLQYLILSLIFSTNHSSKLSFLGGTALRIVYGVNRFSEDLDFDNKNLTFSEFKELSEEVKKGLEEEGFIVEIAFIKKLAFHCNIKFPELLYKEGLSPLPSQKLRISIDTFDQGYNYKPETYIIDKFEIFSRINVTPKSVILAQKLWTITQRKGAKGRDFFDVMSLAATTKPDKAFLKLKFGESSGKKVLKIIKTHIKGMYFDKLSVDVSPFLVNKVDVERIKLFPEYLKQIKW